MPYENPGLWPRCVTKRGRRPKSILVQPARARGTRRRRDRHVYRPGALSRNGCRYFLIAINRKAFGRDNSEHDRGCTAEARTIVVTTVPPPVGPKAGVTLKTLGWAAESTLTLQQVSICSPPPSRAP